MNSKKFSATLTVNSKFASRIQKYFNDLQGFAAGQRIKVVKEWNGHSSGETGILIRRQITKAMGRHVNATVLAVQFSNGEVDWGMHMAEKLEVLK